MAFIHHTTLTPSKLELLTTWLPTRPWYRPAGQQPVLAKAGGFRLDDPQGEVGIEFMVVTDTSGERPRTLLAPLSYRGAPLDEADDALIGTTEHGVLGRRWIYDGLHDPVLVGQLLALATGAAVAQKQGVSDTPEPAVVTSFADAGHPEASGDIEVAEVTDGPDRTAVVVADKGSGRRLVIEVQRVLKAQEPGAEPTPAGPGIGQVTAEWELADGATARGLFAAVHDLS
ncbi:1,4-alpha-glucan branching protein [Streptomyces monticola]|uniref:1,4-alpha-glucan branching protein n=1 Tax=Streptomyces monticola TaxID=2666263 RepID=A0ABW2JW22_9ACTN